MKRIIPLSALLPLALLLAAAPAPRHVSFVACPIARDTGPLTDVCFFADYQGERYSLAGPVDFGSPELGHKVLVEGQVIDDGTRDCGGLKLDGRVSVLPELDRNCQQIVPASPEVPAPPVRYSNDPHTLAMLKMVADDPANSLKPLRGRVPAYPLIEGRHGTETLYLPYGRGRATGPDAMRLVVLSKMPGVKIRITAYRGASRLDDGTLMIEPEEIAAHRAGKFAEIMAGLGVAEVTTKAVTSYSPPTGIDDWKSRRVEISWTAPGR